MQSNVPTEQGDDKILIMRSICTPHCLTEESNVATEQGDENDNECLYSICLTGPLSAMQSNAEPS